MWGLQKYERNWIPTLAFWFKETFTREMMFWFHWDVRKLAPFWIFPIYQAGKNSKRRQFSSISKHHPHGKSLYLQDSTANSTVLFTLSWSTLKKSMSELIVLHSFAIPSSSKNEKHCQMMETLSFCGIPPLYKNTV